MPKAESLYRRHLADFGYVPEGVSQEYKVKLYAACIIAEAIGNAKDEIVQAIKGAVSE